MAPGNPSISFGRVNGDLNVQAAISGSINMERIVVQMGRLFSLNFANSFRDCMYLILAVDCFDTWCIYFVPFVRQSEKSSARACLIIIYTLFRVKFVLDFWADLYKKQTAERVPALQWSFLL